MKNITIEIPGCPPLLLNSRLHWRTLNRTRSDWEALCWAFMKPYKPKKPIQFAHVRYTRFCGYIEPDQTNLASGVKWIEDTLVKVGILAGDSKKFVRNEYLWVACHPRHKRVLIEIIPKEGPQEDEAHSDSDPSAQT